MKACFVCETPYQIFNVINFVTNQVEYKFNKTVLYVGDKFRDAGQICNRITELGIFDSVELYSYAEENNSKLMKVFFRFAYVIFPRAFLKKALLKYPKKNVASDFDLIFVSTHTRFGMAIIMLNSKAKVCFYDDGLGTYQGKIGLASITPKRKFVYKLLGRDFSHLYPEEMYINNESIYHSDWNAVVKPLPSLSQMSSLLNSRLKYIFNEPIKEYSDINIVLLSQPSFITRKSLSVKNDVVCCCLKNTKYILRPHPQEVIDAALERVVVDHSGSLWELTCSHYINENSVLIAKCSTAQVTPKLLYNREPYLIFTHYLYDDVSEKYQNIYHDLFLTVKSFYKRRDKVIEVSSITQLNEVLDRLSNNRMHNEQ